MYILIYTIYRKGDIMESNPRKEAIQMTTTAQKWGNSIGIRIPQKVAKKYGVTNGSEIQVMESKDGIVLKRINEDPTLDELLAQVTDENRHEFIDWGKPEGNEFW